VEKFVELANLLASEGMLPLFVLDLRTRTFSLD
jgi:hypothetical protein